jgi:hypothetical protein
VLVVELRRHSRLLRPLAVEEMLTESGSRTRSGERNCDSGGAGLLTATVKARLWAEKGTEDVGEDWNSAPPIIESAEDTIVRPWSLPFAIRVGVWGSAAGCSSELTATAGFGAIGKGGVGVGGSARFVREREDEREETTLRTRSRRLPVDDEGVKECMLRLAPNDLVDAGVGVGILLYVSDAVDPSSLVKEGGRLRGRCSCSTFSGATAMSESV